MVSTLPVPSFFPNVHYRINEFLAFDFNWTAVIMGLYLAYYYVLEPAAAVSPPSGFVFHCFFSTSFKVPLYATDGTHGSYRHELCSGRPDQHPRRRPCRGLDCAVLWTRSSRKAFACIARQSSWRCVFAALSHVYVLAKLTALTDLLQLSSLLPSLSTLSSSSSLATVPTFTSS
jgi:hypothetical protein